ncbi:MAG TPA: phytanoyl-CoA dioxygenase family protein [Chthonomonadaceae bacterium]|nr:phytanoyl-CoA dioxygenase family protein [Chthonomonadaceae bacterium]
MELTRQELQQGQISPERMAEAVRTFRDTGLLVLDHAFDRAFIAQVRAAYDAELERYLAALGGMKALDGKTFGKRHIGFFLPLTMPFADPQIAAHPVAVQIMTELLGQDLQCSFYHSNTAYPGSTYQPIHRDSGFLFGAEMPVPHPVVSLVLNIPLCDFTEENGSTEVWPGSHLMVDASPEDAKALEARAALLPSIRMNVRAGSLVLRDLRCWHRGVPNRSDRSRAMFAFIYQRGWLHAETITIPKSTWDAWPERARHIFRRNTVVEDAEYRPRVRDYGA